MTSENNQLAIEIVDSVISNLRCRSGLDIEEIVDDPEIFTEIICDLVATVEQSLEKRVVCG